MKSVNQLQAEYLNKYTEHHGVLVKKYRTVFHYVFVIEENKLSLQ